MGMIRLILHDYGYRHLGSQSLSDVTHDISDCFSYDDDIEIQQTRDGIDGVFLEISIPQTFYGDAYVLIRDIYEKYQLAAYAKMSVYRRDNIRVNDYRLLDTFELDFSTIQILDNSLTIDAVKLNLQQVINSNANTTYDLMLYGDFAYTNRLIYERMNLQYFYSLSMLTDTGEIQQPTGDTIPHIISPDVKFNTDNLKNNIVIVKELDEIKSKYFEDNEQDIGILAVNYGTETVRLAINYDFDIGYTTRNNPYVIESYLSFFTGDILENAMPPFYVDVPFTSTQRNYKGLFYVTLPGINAANNANKLRMLYVMRLDASAGLPGYFSIQAQTNDFNISFVSKGGADHEIRGVTPEVLLDGLAKKMTGNDHVKTSIDFITEDIGRTLLLPAESIRNFDMPYFHVSFNNLARWLRALGYVPYYPSDDELKFVHYESLFLSGGTNILPYDDVNNLQILSENSHSYTHILTGYQDQKFDSENGRFNVNGSFEYSTGLILKDNNSLDLRSPFRGDQVGLELLLFERTEDVGSTKDNRSDNDIFAYWVTGYGPEQTAVYYLQSTVNYNENANIKTYDGGLNPFNLAMRWDKYLGVSTGKLTFRSTTANREANWSGIDIFTDIRLPDRLFAPISLQLDAKYIQDLYETDEWRYPVTFQYGDRMISGYLMNSTRAFNREMTSTLELMATGNSFPDNRDLQ